MNLKIVFILVLLNVSKLSASQWQRKPTVRERIIELIKEGKHPEKIIAILHETHFNSTTQDVRSNESSGIELLAKWIFLNENPVHPYFAFYAEQSHNNHEIENEENWRILLGAVNFIRPIDRDSVKKMVAEIFK